MRILDDMHYAISSYIRGQIIVSLFIGIMLLIGYLIIGIKYAVLLAILAMIVNIVPYVGPIIAITPALIIAFIDSPTMVLKVIIVMMVVQLAEGKFISPQVMGKKVRYSSDYYHFYHFNCRKLIRDYGHYFGHSRICDIKSVSYTRL